MDKLTAKARSENMRRIKSKGMKPEMLVRKLVHRLGYRYRLHKRDLPGKPDLVFSSRRKVIFVHGCFWHQHDRVKCSDGRLPKSNTAYWTAKLSRNVERDARNLALLRTAGWKSMVLWECDLIDADRLSKRITAFLEA